MFNRTVNNQKKSTGMEPVNKKIKEEKKSPERICSKRATQRLNMELKSYLHTQMSEKDPEFYFQALLNIEHVCYTAVVLRGSLKIIVRFLMKKNPLI